MSRVFLFRQLPASASGAQINGRMSAIPRGSTSSSVRTFASKPTTGNDVGLRSSGSAATLKSGEKAVATKQQGATSSGNATPAKQATSANVSSTRTATSNWMNSLKVALTQETSATTKEQAKMQLVDYFKKLPAKDLQRVQTRDLVRSLFAFAYLPPPQASPTWQPVVDELVKELLSRNDLSKLSSDDSIYGKNFKRFSRIGKRWGSPNTWEAICTKVLKDIEVDPKLLTPQLATGLLRAGDKVLRDFVVRENSLDALMLNKAQWESTNAEDAVDLFYAFALGTPQPSVNKPMAELMEIAAKKLSQPQQMDPAVVTKLYMKLRHAKGLRDSKLSPAWADGSSLDELRGKVHLKFDPSKFSDYDCHVATAVLASGGRRLLIGKGGKLQNSDVKFVKDLAGEFERRQTLLNKPIKLLSTNLSNFCTINRLYGVPDSAFLVRFSDKLIDSAVNSVSSIKDDLHLVEQILSDLARVASLYPEVLPRTDRFIESVASPSFGFSTGDASDASRSFPPNVSTDKAVRIANYILYTSKPAVRDQLFQTLIATMNERIADLDKLPLRGFLSLAKTFAFGNEKPVSRFPAYAELKPKLINAFCKSFRTATTTGAELSKPDAGVIVRLARVFSQLSDSTDAVQTIGEFVCSNLNSFSSLDLAQLSTETLPAHAQIITKELVQRGFDSVGSLDEKVKLAWSLASSVTSKASGEEKGLAARSAMLEEFRNKQLPSVTIPASNLAELGNETLNQLCKATAALEWRYEFAALADEVLRRVVGGDEAIIGGGDSLEMDKSSSTLGGGNAYEPLNLYSIVYQMQLLSEDEEDASASGERVEETKKMKLEFTSKVSKTLETSPNKFDSSILAHIASAGDAVVRSQCWNLLAQRIETQRELEVKPKLSFTIFPHILPQQQTKRIAPPSPKELALVHKMVDVMTKTNFDKVLVPGPVMVKDLIQLRKLRTYGYVDLPKSKELALVQVLSDQIAQRAETISADELITVAAVLDSFGFSELKRRTEDLLRIIWQARRELSVDKRFELLRLAEDPNARTSVVEELILKANNETSWISEDDFAKIIRSLHRTSGVVPRMDDVVDWAARMGSKLAPNAEMEVLIRAAKLISLHHVKSRVLGLNGGEGASGEQQQSPPSSNRASDAQLQFFEQLAEQIVSRKDLAFATSASYDDIASTSSSPFDISVDLLASMARIRFVSRPDALRIAVDETKKALMSAGTSVEPSKILSLSEVLSQSDVVSTAMAYAPLFASAQQLGEAVRSAVTVDNKYSMEDVQVITKFLDTYLDASKKGPAGWF